MSVFGDLVRIRRVTLRVRRAITDLPVDFESIEARKARGWLEGSRAERGPPQPASDVNLSRLYLGRWNAGRSLIFYQPFQTASSPTCVHHSATFQPFLFVPRSRGQGPGKSSRRSGVVPSHQRFRFQIIANLTLRRRPTIFQAATDLLQFFRLFICPLWRWFDNFTVAFQQRRYGTRFYKSKISASVDSKVFC